MVAQKIQAFVITPNLFLYPQFKERALIQFKKYIFIPTLPTLSHSEIENSLI